MPPAGRDLIGAWSTLSRRVPVTVLSSLRPQRASTRTGKESQAITTLETVRSGHAVIDVDTHKHVHVAAAMDTIGWISATLPIATDAVGFKQLLDWAADFGKVLAFGVEGTGSYGATLTSFLRRHGHKVVEAGRPDRRARRANGKSDTLDAENAARSVLAGFATATPKTADGAVEMIRQLKIAHDSAVADRTASMVTIKAMLVHGADELRRKPIARHRSCSPVTWPRCDHEHWRAPMMPNVIRCAPWPAA